MGELGCCPAIPAVVRVTENLGFARDTRAGAMAEDGVCRVATRGLRCSPFLGSARFEDVHIRVQHRTAPSQVLTGPPESGMIHPCRIRMDGQEKA